MKYEEVLIPKIILPFCRAKTVPARFDVIDSKQLVGLSYWPIIF